MKPSKNQVAAVRSYLSSIGHEISHVQALEVIARGQGHRSRHVVTADLKLSKRFCSKCECPLDASAYCTDAACPYSDWPQAVKLSDLQRLSASEIEYCYAIAKRKRTPDETSSASNADALRLQYGEDNEHPNYPRGDWLFEASKSRTNLTYWDWVALKLEAVEDISEDEDVENNKESKPQQIQRFFNIWTQISGFNAHVIPHTSEKERDSALRKIVAEHAVNPTGARKDFYYFEVEVQPGIEFDDYWDYTTKARVEAWPKSVSTGVVASVSSDGAIHWKGKTYPKSHPTDVVSNSYCGRPTFIGDLTKL